MKIFMESDLESFYKEIRTFRLLKNAVVNNLVIPVKVKDEW